MSDRSIRRRDVLKGLGTAAFGLVPSFATNRGAAASAPPPSVTVAIAPCPKYDRALLLEALRNGWRTTRPPEVRDRRVIIKPNIADYLEGHPINTSPRLIEALILHLKEQGAREIIIAEGPPHNRDSEWIFRRSGFEALAGAQKIRLVDLNYDDLLPVKNPNPAASVLRSLDLPQTIMGADVLVSVAKMKTHRLAGVTLCLKNMFGIVPGMRYGWPKNILHWNGIPSSVCEINAAVKTHYALVDGIVGMEGAGPLLGEAKPVGVLVMGDNPLAVDATAARIMGIDPARVEHLAMAEKVKLGTLNAAGIELAGARLEDVKTEFALLPAFSRLRAEKSTRSVIK